MENDSEENGCNIGSGGGKMKITHFVQNLLFSHPDTRELTDIEISEIKRRISNSRILEKLKEIGFNYEI